MHRHTCRVSRITGEGAHLSLRESHGSIRGVTTSQPGPPQSVEHSVQDSALLRAARREPVPNTPVWFMRQAGRSLPEYLRARGDTTMLQACSTPDLVTEITLQPVRRYGVDGAILFSDIVVPLHAA